MLKNTIAKSHENEKTIIHLDREAHYRWAEWIKLIGENSLIRLMSKIDVYWITQHMKVF